MQQASRCALDAGEQSSRAPWLSHAALAGGLAIRPDSQPASTAIHRITSECRVGHGYHLYPDVAGLALSCGRPGSLLAEDRRVVRRPDDSPRDRPQRRAHGGARSPAARDLDSLGLRDPVRQRRVATFLPLPSAGTEHESEGELLGQCRRGIFLQ